MIGPTVSALFLEIANALQAPVGGFTDANLDTTTGSITFTIAPASSLLRLSSPPLTPVQIAGQLSALVKDPVKLESLNTTWLRRVNPATYTNSTVVYPTASPGPGPSPSSAPAPSGGDTAVIVVVIVIICLLLGVGLFAFYRQKGNKASAGPSDYLSLNGPATVSPQRSGAKPAPKEPALELKKGDPKAKPLISDSDTE